MTSASRHYRKIRVAAMIIAVGAAREQSVGQRSLIVCCYRNGLSFIRHRDGLFILTLNSCYKLEHI